MEKEIEELKKQTIFLWQGKGIDTGELLLQISRIVDNMLYGIEKMKEIGIEFPIMFIKEAMIHLEKSISQRDDYILADCLYYEWLEILEVYEEAMSEGQIFNEK